MLVYRVDHVGNRKISFQPFIAGKEPSVPERKYDTSYLRCLLLKQQLHNNNAWE
jgi:hypothetical protein